MTERSGPASLAVFASGSGTNLGSLIDTFGPDGQPDSAARVALVISDRDGIGALERAQAAGIPTAVINPRKLDGPDAFAEALLKKLGEHGIELIALAGYLRLVPAAVVEAFRGRIVNIHPGPLPTFGGPGMYGRRVHETVLRSGVRVSGPTVHFVDERYDTGPIIAQWPVPVLPGDDSARLAARVLRYEHRLYPQVVKALALGAIELGEDGRARSTRELGMEEVGFALVDETESIESTRLFG